MKYEILARKGKTYESFFAQTPVEAARTATKLAKSGWSTSVYSHSGRRSSRSKGIRWPVMSCEPSREPKGVYARCKIYAAFKKKLKKRR